ncbi:MAG: VIT1/CCC1 transporter family protein [Candidatus Heimdallarchaeota archaeon]|nr:VIT1/CCC1 transporter family protein [Candidatus Heimdallarchaeota archaeon]
MKFEDLSKKLQKKILKLQRSELTAYYIYKKLAKRVKSDHNKKVIEQIAKEELTGYHTWKSITKLDLKPSKFTMKFYIFLNVILGLTFSIKLLEINERRGESRLNYNEIQKFYPEEIALLNRPNPHEERLIALIDEKRLELMGSVTLGLNDALVELTGTLAGFTLALQDNEIIALIGLIMGFAASLSMGASEYLSNKTEGAEKPLQAAYYTSFAYVFVVIFLIFPFFLFSDPFISIGVTVLVALLIIFLFTFYVSVVKDFNFRQRFIEMAVISLGVATVSFGIGYLVKLSLGFDI